MDLHYIDIYRLQFDKDSPDRGILSDLYIDSVFVCNCIEPPRRSKYGCVDSGQYDLLYHYSPSFRQNMYYLDLQKAGSTRSGIMLHAGNNADDSKGCILPGYVALKGSFYVANSRVALSVIYRSLERFGYKNVKLRIHDCYDM